MRGTGVGGGGLINQYKVWGCQHKAFLSKSKPEEMKEAHSNPSRKIVHKKNLSNS
jgi:hypothetical protein